MSIPLPALCPMYHFTDTYHARAILHDGYVRPLIPWQQLDEKGAAYMGMPPSGLSAAPNALWLTDMAEPNREGLGLTKNAIRRDRCEWRFEVATHPRIVPWSEFAKRYGASEKWLNIIQQDRMPERWFVCTMPVRIIGKPVKVTEIAA